MTDGRLGNLGVLALHGFDYTTECVVFVIPLKVHVDTHVECAQVMSLVSVRLSITL